MGNLRLALALCCIIILSTSLRESASIKQFSANLTPTQEPIRTESPSPNKIYKARITQGKIPELKTAILWHAPSYKSLSKNLNPNEQTLIDEEAMRILINGAAEMNEDLMKAKNIISKKEPLLFKIGQLMLSRGLEAEENSSLSNLVFNGRGKDDALDLINRVSAYIYHNYQDFKAFYQATYNRDLRLVAGHQDAKTKLELISGINAVASIEALLNGGRI